MLITTRITVTDFWDNYARDRCAEGISAGRLAQYDSQMKKYIIPELGTMELCRVTRADIDRLRRRLNLSCSSSTQGSIKSLLYKLFHQAVVYGLRPDNPVEGSVKISKPASTTHRYSVKYSQALLRAFQESELAGALTFLFLTGLSKGEVYGLRTGGIDLYDNTITVDQFYALNEDRCPLIMRTSRSYRARRISISECAADVLMDEVISRDKKRRRAGCRWHNEHDLVFTEAYGDPISYNTHLRAVRNVSKYCEYPGTRSLQDNFALTAIELGASVIDLHEYLGHRSYYSVDRYLKSSLQYADEITVDDYYRMSAMKDIARKEN